MNNVAEIQSLLKQHAKKSFAITTNTLFYKTGVGQYAEHDKFIGVSVPTLRKIAKNFSDLAYDDIQILMESPFNEERLLSLLILINWYQKSNSHNKDDIYHFYIRNLKYVNNWNLVDTDLISIFRRELS